MRRILLLAVITLMAILPLCAQNNKLAELRHALTEHYAGDAEKQQAAAWLLDNMQYHGTIRSALQDEYYNKLTRIAHSTVYPECEPLIYGLADSVYAVPDKGFKRMADADAVTAEYLISNIDQAFVRWREGNFARHLSFSEFCEWLLPYRLTNENLCEWRERLYGEYKRGIESLHQIADKNHSAYWAAAQVNDLLKQDKIFIHLIPHLGGVNLPAPVLASLRMGECDDYAFKAAYTMRACGIPVCVDFTPQWPTRPHGHHWNVVLNNNGRTVPFMGSESNPGYPCKSDYVYGKVYRYTYEYQKESLFEHNKKIGEPTPSVLTNPFIKDVTGDYTKGVDVSVSISTDKHFAYLAAFNNQGWTPIAWAGETLPNPPFKGGEKKQYSFRNVGRGAVYLPVTWENDRAVAADYPILIKENGEQKYIKPDKSKTFSLTLTRKYPKYAVTHVYSKRMVGGKFYTSNTADFTESTKIGEIKRNPEMEYDSIDTDSKGRAYRYLRYTAPRRSHCNVAEMEFYDANGKRLLPKTVITDGNEDAGFKAGSVIDGDALTYYQTKKSDDCTLTFDFGSPVAVVKIRYLPRNDDNHVTAGHRYRLDYYDRDGAYPVGEQVATTDSVTFTSVPSNALYILHDLTKGREERIFTLENGEIRWW